MLISLGQKSFMEKCVGISKPWTSQTMLVVFTQIIRILICHQSSTKPYS